MHLVNGTSRILRAGLYASPERAWHTSGSKSWEVVAVGVILLRIGFRQGAMAVSRKFSENFVLGLQPLAPIGVGA
ncbi:hypothetical protein D3C71_1085990 [compost metagenome]